MTASGGGETRPQGDIVNVDNIRAALDAAPAYPPCAGRLVEAGDDGALRFPFDGALCDAARLHGAPMELVCTAAGVVFHTAADTLPHFLLADWLGVDVLTLRVRVGDLPVGLRHRIEAVLDVERALRPGPVDWAAEAHRIVRGYDVMDLSDRGVPYADIADALRVVLDIDAETVNGSAAQLALVAAQEAAEGAPWADATTSAAVAS